MTTNKMWGGRFSGSPAAIMEEINASIGFDQRLFREDIEASKAHCRMLLQQGLLREDDASAILGGLSQILQEINEGTFSFSRALEDIHMNVENRLSELIGEPAGRLHTARSRNDQVATDFRLYVRGYLTHLDDLLVRLQWNLANRAFEEAYTIMPGFTHLQIAQPITYGHYLLAYVEMIDRDRGRFRDAKNRLNVSPLGACALAGTSFPIDREKTAKDLGFDGPMRNSIDAVSDRDFVLETLAACSICATHLSRFAEEIVLFCSSHFAFIKLSDRWTTGSSIMPQKRNPDAAELVRAKTGGILGSLISLLVVMKGLPLAYSKDMQEDKENSFRAFDALLLSVEAMLGMVEDLEPRREAMQRSAAGGFSTATDLADWLVLNLDIPFRQAHHITGQLVSLAERSGRSLTDLLLEEMQDVEPRITEEVFSVLSLEASVSSRKSFGGTAPQLVEESARSWIVALKKYFQQNSASIPAGG